MFPTATAITAATTALALRRLAIRESAAAARAASTLSPAQTTPPPPPPPLKVAVSGAGPAGLTLASILSHHRHPDGQPAFDITVFERDGRDRDQGAGWDIDDNSKKAFERAGLDWRTIVREGSDTWRIFRVGDELPVAMVSMPEIVKRLTGTRNQESNRQAMREGLLAAMTSSSSSSTATTAEEGKQAAPTARVCFDTRLKGMTTTPDGTAELTTTDGTSLGTFDLVVDASGVGSPFRPLRMVENDASTTSTAQYYNGLTMVNGIVNDPEASLDPALVRMLGEGTVEIHGDRPDGEGGFTLLLQRYGSSPSDHRAKLQTFFVRERRKQLAEELQLGRVPYSHISAAEHPEVYGRVIDLIKRHMGDKWPKMYHDLVDALEPVQVWDLHQFPFDAQVKDDPAEGLPLVLIGDALHAMSPTSGSGGNLAVRDAGDLATYIIAAYACGAGGAEAARGRVAAGLVPLMRELLARMEPNQRKGEWNARRFRRVLETKRPIEEWYTSSTPWIGTDKEFGRWAPTFLSLMHRLHSFEGFGFK